ncbi:MAG: hypothetical protein EZS28_007103 [Streblomastix strix]|uniref:Uncharacterized protein n=1 Tax=Streblomastix strix TaxID=222440 RepID=A0A5J4WR34_9EUKA|nr:MAG: hypothetical protein EZS28_007103 [Streblomastix strix]
MIIYISPFEASLLMFYYETLPLGPTHQESLPIYDVGHLKTRQTMINKGKAKEILFRPSKTQATLHILYPFPLATVLLPKRKKYGGSFARFTEPIHRNMAISSTSAHTYPRFSTQRNLFGCIYFISMAVALVRAVYFYWLYARAGIRQLNTLITSEYIGINNYADGADQYGRKLGFIHACDRNGPTCDRNKFTNAVQSNRHAPDSFQTCHTISNDFSKNDRQSTQRPIGKPNRSRPFQTQIAEFSNTRRNYCVAFNFSILIVDWILWNLTIGPVQPIQHIATVPTGSASLELLCRPTTIAIHLGVESFSTDQLLRIVHRNSSNTSVITVIAILAIDLVAIADTGATIGSTVGLVRLLQQPKVYQIQPLILPTVQMQTSGVVQPPTLNRQVIQPIADTTQRGKDIERHQTHQIQMNVSWERSPPAPNINTQIGERLKGHFSRLEERMSKVLIQQHRTAWDLEGYDLVDQKSRHSDPPPAGYAEGNMQTRQFFDAHNRGNCFYIHEYQAFWKEYCQKLFNRKLQQSDKRKDFSSPPKQTP